MSNSCNHEHKDKIEKYIICCSCTRRRGRYLPTYILGRVSVITKVIQVIDFSDTNQQRSRQIRPKHLTYKDHVYLDRLFLLSNLTWHRAHVTAGLTGRDPNVNVNALRHFRSIYGDCNAILLFTSRKKSPLLFCFRDMSARRVLVCQDKWFVSVSN